MLGVESCGCSDGLVEDGREDGLSGSVIIRAYRPSGRLGVLALRSWKSAACADIQNAIHDDKVLHLCLTILSAVHAGSLLGNVVIYVQQVHILLQLF